MTARHTSFPQVERIHISCLPDDDDDVAGAAAGAILRHRIAIHRVAAAVYMNQPDRVDKFMKSKQQQSRRMKMIGMNEHKVMA